MQDNLDAKRAEKTQKRKRSRRAPAAQPAESIKTTAIAASREPLALPETFRKEKNFLEFPFFVLGKGRGVERIEFQDVVYDKHGNRAEIYWAVIGSKKYGSPSILEMRVSNYVDRVIDLLPKPIENPIRIGTLYEICKGIGRGVSGRDFNQVKNAIKCIKATTIETKFTFWLKDKGEYYGEPVFNRYDMVFFTGSKMPDGLVADAVYVWLSSPYLQSVNANYTVPLDREYYGALSLPVSQRLYEFYSLQFYPSFERKMPCAKIRYSKLCKYAPLTRHKKFSYVRQQLEPAHKEFMETGFLRSADFERVKDDGDWIISLRPGERARKWYLKGQRREEQLPLFPEGGEDKDLFERLVEAGITKKSAFELMQGHSLEDVRRQLDWLPFRKPEDAPAVLFKAIQEGWSAPKEYLKARKEEKKREKEREIREQKAREEEKARKGREKDARELETFYRRSLTEEERKDVETKAEEALPPFLKARLRKGRGDGGMDSHAVKACLEENRRAILREIKRSQERG